MFGNMLRVQFAGKFQHHTIDHLDKKNSEYFARVCEVNLLPGSQLSSGVDNWNAILVQQDLGILLPTINMSLGP